MNFNTLWDKREIMFCSTFEEACFFRVMDMSSKNATGVLCSQSHPVGQLHFMIFPLWSNNNILGKIPPWLFWSSNVKQEVKYLSHIWSIRLAQRDHMSFGSGSSREGIGSGSKGDPLWLSEPLIGLERSHDFGRGSASDPLPIRSRSDPEIDKISSLTAIDVVKRWYANKKRHVIWAIVELCLFCNNLRSTQSVFFFLQEHGQCTGCEICTLVFSSSSSWGCLIAPDSTGILTLIQLGSVCNSVWHASTFWCGSKLDP